MKKISGVVLDYNGTFVPGYHEIPLGYAVLAESYRKHGLNRRVLELAVPLHIKCLYLTLAHKMDELGKYFAENVLKGEEAEFVDDFSRRFDIHDQNNKWARRGLRTWKIGKKMDTKPIEGAVKYVKKAKEGGRKTGIWSHAFQQPIENNLKRYDLWELFNEVEANPWIVDKRPNNDKIVGVEQRVAFDDKSKDFREFLSRLGLKEDGDGVVYVGDSEQDFPVFKMVEYPAIAPGSKEKMKEKLNRYDHGLWARTLTFPDWDGLSHYTLDE